jgi:Bacterial PH domain
MRTPREFLADIYDGLANWLGRVADDGGVTTISRRRIGGFFSPENLFGHRRVVDKLIPNERTIDVHRRRSAHAEVTHSKILYIVPGLIALFGLFLLFRWVLFVPLDDIGFPLLVVLGILGYASFRFLKIIRDRFVVTDSRVFRVWGVWTLHSAEMEIVRVLDITVERPWYLRPFSAGHIILENAAQEQGLRELRVVPDPEIIATAIHRRRREMMGLAGDGGDLADFGDRAPAPRRGRRPDHPRSPGPTTARPH